MWSDDIDIFGNYPLKLLHIPEMGDVKVSLETVQHTKHIYIEPIERAEVWLSAIIVDFDDDAMQLKWTQCAEFYIMTKKHLYGKKWCTRVSILYFLNSSTVVLTYSVRWKLQNLQDKCNERSLINLLLADCDIFAASKAEVFKFTVPDIILYFLLIFF